MAGTLTIAIRLELLRRDYKALSRIPITLALLVHVLCRGCELDSEGWSGKESAMSKVKVYDKAIDLMLSVDVFKARFRRPSDQGFLPASAPGAHWQDITFAKHFAGRAASHGFH